MPLGLLPKSTVLMTRSVAVTNQSGLRLARVERQLPTPSEHRRENAGKFAEADFAVLVDAQHAEVKRS